MIEIVDICKLFEINVLEGDNVYKVYKADKIEGSAILSVTIKYTLTTSKLTNWLQFAICSASS